MGSTHVPTSLGVALALWVTYVLPHEGKLYMGNRPYSPDYRWYHSMFGRINKRTKYTFDDIRFLRTLGLPVDAGSYIRLGSTRAHKDGRKNFDEYASNAPAGLRLGQTNNGTRNIAYDGTSSRDAQKTQKKQKTK
jgi:hypothetical protein